MKENFDYLKCTRMKDFTLFIAEPVYHGWRNFEFWRPKIHQNEGFYCTWFLAEHLHHDWKFLDIDYLKWSRMKDYKWQLQWFQNGIFFIHRQFTDISPKLLFLLTFYWHFPPIQVILLTFTDFTDFTDFADALDTLT